MQCSPVHTYRHFGGTCRLHLKGLRLRRYVFSFLNSHSGGLESKLGPLGTSATEWPIVPAPGDYDDGEFGGMKTGRGNRSTRRKPQIPLDQTRF
jgi:hypothetical protein